jgi:hypothetical protein
MLRHSGRQRVEAEQELPEDLAEIVFDTRDAIPLGELADSFNALDRLFAREARSGARLAVAEIRKGSIVALLAPFIPIMGPSISLVSAAIDVGDFVKRLRDGLSAFAGIVPVNQSAAPSVDGAVAAEIAELVKPLAGRAGSRLDVAHVKYRSRTKQRVVEIEASFGAAEIDRIAINAGRAAITPPLLSVQDGAEPESAQPSLLRNVVLALQQTNTGPAKEKGKTADRGIIRTVSDKPLAVYFARTIDDLKQKMVGRSSNPFRQPFKVDALVAYEGGEAKSYTVIEVHGAYRPRKKKGPPDLLSDIA